MLSGILSRYLTAANEGITQPDLVKATNTTSASVSRGLKQMGLFKDKGKTKGFDLIYLVPDLVYRRRLAAHLTPKGKALISKLL